MIAAFFFFETRKKTIRIPKVCYDMRKMCWILKISPHFLNHSDGQSLRLDVVVGIDADNRFHKLSSDSVGFYSNSAWIRIVWCIEPCYLVDCIVLHYFRMHQQSWRCSKFNIGASFVETHFQNLLLDLFDALFRDSNDNGVD